MAKNSADTVIILSSELIAQVMEVYFNQEMFKIPVKIVDLKASSDGYAFSLLLNSVKEEKTVEKVVKVEEKPRIAASKSKKGEVVSTITDSNIEVVNNG